MFEIVVATANSHKLDELKALLALYDEEGETLELHSMRDFPHITPCEETGHSFEDNACQKALHVCAATHQVTLADDSGLVVEALDGAPGIYSARYAGESATDADNITKLMAAMKNEKNRKAKFVCTLAIAHENEIIATFTGEVHGTLLTEQHGVHGFGYDPIFVPDGETQTFAELTDIRKNQISHRAHAVKQAIEFFEELSACLG